MSYSVVYAGPEMEEQDGDQVATGAGWLAWGDHVLAAAADFPECAHLAEEGWTGGSAEGLADLEHELEQLAHAKDPDAAAISANLLAAVKARPAGCDVVMVTDGTEQDEDAEGGDDDDE